MAIADSADKLRVLTAENEDLARIWLDGVAAGNNR
jgi:hypothetical protein